MPLSQVCYIYSPRDGAAILCMQISWFSKSTRVIHRRVYKNNIIWSEEYMQLESIYVDLWRRTISVMQINWFSKLNQDNP